MVGKGGCGAEDEKGDFGDGVGIFMVGGRCPRLSGGTCDV